MAHEYHAHLHDALRKRIGGQRRIEILEATSSVVIERGFQQSRFTDVATASDVSVGTLQHYFGALENLLIEACLYTCDTDYGMTRDIALSIKDPWDRLLWIVKLMMACDRPGLAWQVRIELWHAAIGRPYLRDEVARMQTDWRQLVEDALVYGQKSGTFPVSGDPRRIATQLVATCNGTVFPVWMDNPDFDIQAFEEMVVEDLSAALESRPAAFISLDDVERRYRHVVGSTTR
jgi:AcrR family transcriptional regulator